MHNQDVCSGKLADVETRETVAVCVKCGLSHGNRYGVVDHDSASGYAVKYSNNHDGRAIGCETGNDNDNWYNQRGTIGNRCRNGPGAKHRPSC